MKNKYKLLVLLLTIISIISINILVNNKITFMKNKSEIKYDSTTEKEVTGLGISPIINPEYGNGNWNKVWFGSGSAPIRFNVLNTHETNISQGKVGMLLDSDSLIRGHDKAMRRSWLYEWYDSDLAKSVSWIVDDRFRGSERTGDILLPPNKPNKADTDGPDVYTAGNLKYTYTNPRNKYSNAFILDAYEITNASYGFPTSHSASALRKKSGGTEYWLRSENGNLSQSDYLGYVSDSSGMGLKSDGWNEESYAGVNIAINLNSSKVLFSSLVNGVAGTHNAEYKLTIIDEYYECGSTGCTNYFDFRIRIPDGKSVTRDGKTLTIPFSITNGNNKGAIDQISVLVTDKPWNSEGAKILKYGKLQNIDGDIHSSGIGTFTLPDDMDISDESDGGGYVYLFAEDIKEGNATDHASNLIKLDFKRDMKVTAKGYNDVYDGEEHGISVKATPKGETTVKYGLVEGIYNLDESPKYKDAGTNVRVYYQATSPGRETITGAEYIKIGRRPVTISGITADDKEYNGALNATINTDNVTFEGIIEGDRLSITDASGMYYDKNVGTDKEIELDYTLVGYDILNYEIDEDNSQKTTVGNIYPREVKVSGIRAYDKVFDGTSNAELDFSDLTFDRKIAGDDLFITATGQFAGMAPFENLTVYINNIELIGFDKGNYVLAETGQQETTTASIKQRGTYPIINITGREHTYDGNAHTINVTATSTVEDADPAKVSVLYNLTGRYSDPWFSTPDTFTDVGTHKIYYYVSDLNNLTTTIDGVFFRILPRPIKVNDNSITVASKVYDGNTSATLDLTSATFDDAIDGDDISITNGTGKFASANVGENQEVTLNGLTLGGDEANNYRVTSNAKTKGTITKRPLTITGIKANNKTYDGTTDVTFDTDDIKIDNLVNGDDVNVLVTGSFVNDKAGNDKTVNLSLELTGSKASNYYIDEDTSQTTTKADIAKKDFVLDLNNVDTEYDGQSHKATVSVDELVPVTIKYGTSPDDCTLDESPSYTEIGSYDVYYTITTTNENYNSKNGVLNVKISPRNIIISGITANNKNYNGKTDVTLNTDNMKIENILDGDDVKVSVKGSFEDAKSGKNKTVNLSYTLSGTDKDKYYIIESMSQINTTANIIDPPTPQPDEDKDTPNSGPKTGDNINFYIIMLGISVIGLTTTIIYSKKARVI